jgi:hypothetical protein
MKTKDTFTNLVDKITSNTPNYTSNDGKKNKTSSDADMFGEGSRVENSYDNKLNVVGEGVNDLMPQEFKKGTESIFNEHAIITVGNGGLNYKDIGKSLWFDEKGDISPTAKNIITKWNEKNPFAPYKIEDFLYAKHYGAIPNNHLITLRRFYRPTFDNMQVHVVDGDVNITRNDFKTIHYPISTAVTWFGNETGNDIGKLMGFTCGLKWETQQSQLKDHTMQGVGMSDDKSTMAKIFRSFALGTNDPNVSRNEWKDQLSSYNYWEQGPYQNRIYGPINAIFETMKRDRGLDFEQKFEIEFHYTLRSISSNNPKLVMLDIMSNFLSLCFNFGQFWGGAYRYWPALIKSPLPGGMASISQLYSGDVDTIMKYSKSLVTQMMSNATSKISGMKDTLSSLLSGDWKGAANQFLAGAQNSGLFDSLINSLSIGDMTSVMSLPPLLTGEPVGEWHLTVGNPFNPTMMIGNLVCSGLDVSFNNEMHFEGFPTEMTFKVTLQHGRARDSGDIQSMFNRGNGRIYHYKDSEINPDDSAATKNSKIDNSTELAKKYGFGTQNDSNETIKRGWGNKK